MSTTLAFVYVHRFMTLNDMQQSLKAKHSIEHLFHCKKILFLKLQNVQLVTESTKIERIPIVQKAIECSVRIFKLFFIISNGSYYAYANVTIAKFQTWI